MSVDFEKVTLEQLSAMKRSQQLEYATYWAKISEDGVELEVLYKVDGCWNSFYCHSHIVQTGCLYRLKPQPTKKIVPLDFSDFLNINLRWIIDTRTKEKCFIGDYSYTNVKLLIKQRNYVFSITFEELQEHFTRLDGSRLEKEIVA